MAKASDILNKTGAVPVGQAPKTSSIKPNAVADGSGDEHATGKKLDTGHNIAKVGKAKGGGGGSSARPKV